jgi:lambda family phage portal protein
MRKKYGKRATGHKTAAVAAQTVKAPMMASAPPASGPSAAAPQGPASTAPRIANYGYSEAGASHKKKAFKAFRAESSSAQKDIDENNGTLRQRARMLYMAAPVATSAIKTNRTNVIGCGLKLKSSIDAERLGISRESADAWQKKTEAEFNLWAGRKNACDATGVNDFYAMQQVALMSWLMNGDVFGLIERKKPTPLCPYSLRIHLIEADRCSTPVSYSGSYFFSTEGKAQNGNRIYDGVEIDADGMIEAYHFRSTYPDVIAKNETEWIRVEAYAKKTGNPNVLHVMDAERVEQYRGVSYLAQIIEPILQMRRYTEGELMAALVQSFFSAFIKTTANPDENPMNPVNGSEVEPSSPDDYELGPGTINVLKVGEDVDFGNPNRPTSGFGNFIRSMCEQCGGALEIPADLLLKSFNNSYSASRAALLEAWKAFRMRREWFSSDFCKPVYEIWLAEAIALGRIRAPGFFSDPLIRAAWSNSEWIGPSQGQLDPVKEITAEILANQYGYSTHEQSTIRLNGGQWEANINRLKQENELLAEALGTTIEKQEKNTQAMVRMALSSLLKNEEEKTR